MTDECGCCNDSFPAVKYYYEKELTHVRIDLSSGQVEHGFANGIRGINYRPIGSYQYWASLNINRTTGNESNYSTFDFDLPYCGRLNSSDQTDWERSYNDDYADSPGRYDPDRILTFPTYVLTDNGYFYGGLGFGEQLLGRHDPAISILPAGTIYEPNAGIRAANQYTGVCNTGEFWKTISEFESPAGTWWYGFDLYELTKYSEGMIFDNLYQTDPLSDSVVQFSGDSHYRDEVTIYPFISGANFLSDGLTVMKTIGGQIRAYDPYQILDWVAGPNGNTFTASDAYSTMTSSAVATTSFMGNAYPTSTDGFINSDMGQFGDIGMVGAASGRFELFDSIGSKMFDQSILKNNSWITHLEEHGNVLYISGWNLRHADDADDGTAAICMGVSALTGDKVFDSREFGLGQEENSYGNNSAAGQAFNCYEFGGKIYLAGTGLKV